MNFNLINNLIFEIINENKIEKFKDLFIYCTYGNEYQNYILKNITLNFILNHFNENDKYFLKILSLCNNLCIENLKNQEILLNLLFPLISKIKWNIKNSSNLLLFLITCFQPNSPFLNLLNLNFLEPFIQLSINKEDIDENDEFDYNLIFLLSYFSTDLIYYALANPKIAYNILDLLLDITNNFSNNINFKTFISTILEIIQNENINPSMFRSNLLNVFANLIGFNINARNEAINQNAINILLNMNKNDFKDPALLEWSIASIRFMTQFIDPPDNVKIFENSIIKDKDENFLQK